MSICKSVEIAGRGHGDDGLHHLPRLPAPSLSWSVEPHHAMRVCHMAWGEAVSMDVEWKGATTSIGNGDVVNIALIPSKMGVETDTRVLVWGVFSIRGRDSSKHLSG